MSDSFVNHLSNKQLKAFMKSGVMNPVYGQYSTSSKPSSNRERLDFSDINRRLDNRRLILNKMSRPKSTYHEHMFNTLHQERPRNICNFHAICRNLTLK